jgi:putative flavoprotein involved in K+ transport
MNTRTITPAPRRVSAVIIGAGQAGLATSHCLAEEGIDHVVLERGEVANSWRRERWDSLRLLTPNWQSQLPGYGYAGADPDGYMSMPELIHFIQGYARSLVAPLHTRTRVTAVSQRGDGYRVQTDRGDWHCRALVIATGAFNRPALPALAGELGSRVHCLSSRDYRNPGQLGRGGVLVVGAAATGLQLAEELRRSGREVILAVGEHVRMPRTYRGRDIMYWMHVTGLLDQRYDEVEDLRRLRRLPSPQLVGSPERATLDLNALSASGVQLAGRLAGLDGRRVQFSGSLANVAKLADLKLNRLLMAIDGFIDAQGLAGEVGPPERQEPTRLPEQPRLDLDLSSGAIETVLWATGLRPDYSWLQVPVLDAKGQLRHEGGVAAIPGLYVMGLPFMRRRKSSFLFGTGDDARAISRHLTAYLGAGAGRRALSA